MRSARLPLLLIVFTLTPFAAVASDLRLGKSAHASGAVGAPPAVTYPGGSVRYELSVANLGATPASSVVVSDPLPAGTEFEAVLTLGVPWSCTTPAVGSGGVVTCTLPSLAPGAVVFFVVLARVVATYPAPQPLVNTATVSAASIDPAPANNTAQAVLPVALPAPVPMLDPLLLVTLL